MLRPFRPAARLALAVLLTAPLLRSSPAMSAIRNDGDAGRARTPAHPADPADIAPPAPPATAAAGAGDGAEIEALRRDVAERLNADRRAAGAPPLARSAALDRAAQRRVDEIVAAGSLRSADGSQDVMLNRLGAAGYEAQQWNESLVSGPADAAHLAAAWHDDSAAGGYRNLLDRAYTDIGVGAGSLGGTPIYSVICAAPRAAAFAAATASLRDVARVRRELLLRINALRREAKRSPLAENHPLEEAAQLHAQDMLARSYFGHFSPDHRSVRERARAAGFDWSTVGENIAEGQTTVDQVVDAWMASPEHRANIQNPTFDETGIGLAQGRDPRTAQLRVVWVQTFGHRP